MTEKETTAPDADRQFTVAGWLMEAANDYLFDRGGKESAPSFVEGSPLLREEAIRNAVQLLVGERCALAAGAGLINAAESQRTKIYLATQVLDAARHVEAFTDRMVSLGVDRDGVEDVVLAQANPDLLSLAETALGPITKGDFIVGLIGQNVVLTEIMLAAYELLEAFNRRVDPEFSDVLVGMIAAKQRHLAFADQTLGRMVVQHPEKKSEIVALATRLSRHMIHAFADLFRDNPTVDELRRLRESCRHGLAIEWQGLDLIDAPPGALEETIIALIARRLKKRLGLLGMGYRTPRPLELR